MTEKTKSRRKPRTVVASEEGTAALDRALDFAHDPAFDVAHGGEVKFGSKQPVEFSAAVAEEICERVALGEPLRQIALLPQLPGEVTIYRWLLKYPEFKARYLEARELQAEKLAEEILDIADDARNDWMQRESARSGKAAAVVSNAEAVPRSRLRVAVRQWLISRWNPKIDGGPAGPEDSGESDGNVWMLTEERWKELMEKKREAMMRRLAREAGGNPGLKPI